MTPSYPPGGLPFAAGSNVLLLAEADHATEHDACIDLLTVTDLPNTNVLGITFAHSVDERLGIWRNHGDDVPPARVAIIAAGETARSAQPPMERVIIPTSCRSIVSVRPVADPDDLPEVANIIGEYLSRWADDATQPVICLYSISALLESNSPTAIRAFLDEVTRTITDSTAIAHYHLDPSACPDSFLFDLEPVFDAVIHVGASPTDTTTDGDEWHSYRIDSDDEPATAVVRAVAAVTNTPVDEVELLHHSVETDAFAALLDHAGDTDTALSLTLTYGGCEVVVTPRYVRVRELTASERGSAQ